jgi:hypothetical protein
VVLVIFNVVNVQFGGWTEKLIVGVVFRLRAPEPVQSTILDFMLLEKLVRVVGKPITFFQFIVLLVFTITFISCSSLLFA